MNIKRFYAVFKARNIEFFRDKSSLSWNLVFPVLLLVGLSVIFSGDGRAVYKVGVMDLANVEAAFTDTRYIEFIGYHHLETARQKLSRHHIDLLIDFAGNRYWVNEQSPKSYLAEKIFLASQTGFAREEASGRQIRYVDWVLPGILGMNMMFSCLFGVGYVIVRYRKNLVLKRLKATPLSAFEFVCAQLLSRLFIVMLISVVIYAGCNMFFDFYMSGSYVDLLLIGILGGFSLITLALLMSSRSKSEELVGGLLNMTSWPMMLLSGVWFSLEGAPEFLKHFADFLPLTHLVKGAREVITEGASLAQISDHLLALALMSTVFLSLGAWLFSWNDEG
ncbi:ABC transporter permease [Thalassomonas viridans]|uniref:ABC transporter permease n=1 Tax=Thalassomonas viridans TaxID=137584 RepID=A0AAE9Z3W1_9GAMM|nr:ABC transporter permease [Thalassomonas viridans]WDE06341.1 ABC transporter permease [Thalassomonas viridans]